MRRNRNQNILALLTYLPWWVSIATALIVYLFLALVLPNIAVQSKAIAAILHGFSGVAHIVALVFLLPAPFAYFRQRKNRQRLDSQNSIQTIRTLSWREFESLVAEAYRRLGYLVWENTQAGADGGVDIWLRKDGGVHLVQCKQWRSQKVGVNVVREMYGVMIAENAQTVAIVTSGRFTQEAEIFARGKPVDLVDGTALLKIITGVQVQTRSFDVSANNVAFTATSDTSGSEVDAIRIASGLCPKCGGHMVLRKASKGINKGSHFLGCSGFPACRHVEQLKNKKLNSA